MWSNRREKKKNIWFFWVWKKKKMVMLKEKGEEEKEKEKERERNRKEKITDERAWNRSTQSYSQGLRVQHAFSWRSTNSSLKSIMRALPSETRIDLKKKRKRRKKKENLTGKWLILASNCTLLHLVFNQHKGRGTRGNISTKRRGRWQRRSWSRTREQRSNFSVSWPKMRLLFHQYILTCLFSCL